MKKTGTLLALSLLAASPVAHAQFSAADIQYWVGAGADSSVLVVDFRDGTMDSTYAWGYLHDGTATAQDMLNDIAAADVNFNVNIGGGFLSDITYNDHAGIGNDPDYWSTWSGTDIATMTMNGGIGTALSNGDWFGCSYGFNPPLAPAEPIAAFDPLAFTAADITYWIGSGPDSTVLVVDFQDGSGASSFAWGYLHGAGTTAETMIADIAAADPSFVPVIGGGFLSDITYGDYAGIGGEPDWWGTWSATNPGNWYMNVGLGTELGNGDFFGCSYTDFEPPLRPGTPVTSGTTAVAGAAGPRMQVWPQPAMGVMHIGGITGAQRAEVFNMAGARILDRMLNGPEGTVDVQGWPAGTYMLRVGGINRLIAVQ